MKYTAQEIKSLKPEKLHCDGNGLYIRLNNQKMGNWCIRYRWQGRTREMGLGPYPQITLKQARMLRDEALIMLAKGNYKVKHTPPCGMLQSVQHRIGIHLFGP